MGHTLAYSAKFHNIHVYEPYVMPLAPGSCRYGLPRVMERVVAWDMMKMYRKFMGSHLLVISINGIRFDLTGTREFPAIMACVLFS